jgi:peptidoglycan/xylan/chitin deacetylase (PgdA/CDA1 family)
MQVIGSRVPVLMYHGLSAARSPITITPGLFAQQMLSLHDGGVRVLPLRDLVARVRLQAILPRRALAITFDDGLRSVYTGAWPVLARYGFPATVFLVAGHCGRDNDWKGQPAGMNRAAMLSWDEVRELDRHGMDIGAHTLDHPRLDLLTHDAVDRQVAGGKAAIETELGHPIDLFAYPYGRHTPAIRRTVADLYAGACTARPGLVAASSDPWLLDRIDVAYVSHPTLLASLFSPAFPAYLSLRRILRRLAGRLFARAWD